MSLEDEIEAMKAKVARDEQVIKDLQVQIQRSADDGLDTTAARKRLVELQHVQRARSEALDLANVFLVMNADLKKE